MSTFFPVSWLVSDYKEKKTKTSDLFFMWEFDNHIFGISDIVRISDWQKKSQVFLLISVASDLNKSKFSISRSFSWSSYYYFIYVRLFDCDKEFKKKFFRLGDVG